MTQIDHPVYPSLRDAADKAAAKAQSTFLALNLVQLIVLAAVSFCAGLSMKTAESSRVIAVTSSLLMFVALAITSALRIRKLDDRWFRCRAYAENFKGAVWRLLMASSETPAENAETYLDQIKQLGDRLPDLQYEFTRLGGSGELITKWMDTFMTLSLEQKLSLYRRLRIEDQITWYTDKSAFNARLETIAFVTILIVEFVTVAVAILQAWLLLSFNMTGLLATLGTSIVAWSQIKRYSDLETSYSIAAIDLRRLAEKHRQLASQNETNTLVAEVEAAVSREHSLWLAKRVPSAC